MSEESAYHHEHVWSDYHYLQNNDEGVGMRCDACGEILEACEWADIFRRGDNDELVFIFHMDKCYELKLRLPFWFEDCEDDTCRNIDCYIIVNKPIMMKSANKTAS